MIFNQAFEVKSWISETLINKPGNFVKAYGLYEDSRHHNFIGSANPANVINGVSLGTKGREDYIVNILLSAKVPIDKSAIARYFNISNTDIQVRTVGPIEIQRRVRPLTPGTSMAHYNVTAGTFGCVVQDNFKNHYFLSNNHVFADTNRATLGDMILQPGSYDGGDALDVAAYLEAYVPINSTGINAIDAAIAQPAETFYTDLLRIGRINGITNPRIGMKVKKMGRTTGYTIGEIVTRSADIKVNYGNDQIHFEDQFEVKGINMRFSDGGDSGSLIVEAGTNMAVGLLFAGNQSGTTFANPINKVLDAFDVRIV